MPERHRVPPHSVDRPGLRHQLDAGLSAPLTLLVAPAGAGKTVLLSQWVETRSDLASAWFDVTSADDDSVHFAQRIVRGLVAQVPGLGEIAAPLGEPGGGLGEATLEALSAAMADAADPLVVVFDDLHTLSNRAIVEDLWRLADRLPDNAHLVFSSRTDLQLSWSRHRLRHGLVELRQAQLALDSNETTEVLEQITGTAVDDDTAAAITRHTEGWAAGIQLAGLTLRFRGHAESLVDTLDETDRLIIDYLSEEVLDAQTPQRREALLRMSVLDEMCAGLVHALTDVDDAEGLLRDLVRESMFVIPLPARRGWYRFHPLFRDVLRYRLRATDAAAEGRLLRTAADWYIADGDSPAAIECLLAARCWQDALDLILQRGRSVFERGHTATVARWLSFVPTEVRQARPGIEALYGIMTGMTGRAGEAEDVLRGLLADPRTDDGHRLVASGYLAAVVQFRPYPEIYLDDAVRTMSLLDSEPQLATPDLLQLSSPDMLTALALVSAGRAYLFMGRLDDAREWMQRGVATVGGQYPPYRVHGLGSLALVEAWVGNLRAAAEHADEALDLAREASLLTHPAPADAYLARAFVAIQRGESESGAMSLHEGNLRAAANQRTQLMWIAHLASKLIDPAGTDPAAIEPVGAPPPIVRQGLRALAHRLARIGSEQPTPIQPQHEWSPLAFEELAGLLTEGRADAARTRLEQIPFTPDPLAPGPAVEHLIISAWLCAVEGRVAASREEMIAALDLAEPEWLVHPFLRAGAAVSPLIDALPGRPGAFRRILVSKSARAGSPPARGLIEPLTARELEILAYLPTRLTNTDLAARFFVSVNTIKTHMAHIYRKLEVTGRTAAVERAAELGLIDAADTAYVH